ncbi:MAG: hypothetical protein IJZ79_05565 [Bacilli bacterium]|nr:hypothetical protein [Bacilli bacterium]
MDNFKWIIDDINDSMILRVFFHDEDGNIVSNTCNGIMIKKLDTSNLEIEDGNIMDMRNLLLGMIRFYINNDNNKIIDIPFRKILTLYEKASSLKEGKNGRSILLNEIDGFSSVDIIEIEPVIIEEIRDELKEFLTLSSNCLNFNIQEEFDMLFKLNEINQKRIDSKGYGR